MIPYENDYITPKVTGLNEQPLVVHGVCKQDSLDISELPINAFESATTQQIAYGHLVAICSESPPIIHSSEAISAVFEDPKRVMKIAVGHNTILSHIVQTHDVLPLKLGTVCGSQVQVRHLLAKNTEHFDICLKQIVNAVEYGLKIIETEAQKSPQETMGAAHGEPNIQSGQDYLRHQAKNVSHKRQLVGMHKAFTADLMQAMSFFVRETRVLPISKTTPAAKTRHIFNSAFLVDRGNVKAFQGCADSYSEMAHSKGLAMSVSGPWPAYNFVSISH